MRHLMFLLGMVAALAGSPLRIAEAAHDLGRALAEEGDQGALEIPDGGVGDDSGATIKADLVDPSFGDFDVCLREPFANDPTSLLGSASLYPPTTSRRLYKSQRVRC